MTDKTFLIVMGLVILAAMAIALFLDIQWSTPQPRRELPAPPRPQRRNQ